METKTEKLKLEKAAFILKTIAHPTRLAVIHFLNKKGPSTVSEICLETSCEQSLLSHHLSNMKLKGILNARKEGTNVYYSLKEKELCTIIQLLDNCNCNF